MNGLRKSIMIGSIALLASCSNDSNELNNGIIDDSQAVYFTVSLSQKTSTRTATSTDGKENAAENESKIYNVQLIFADSNDKYIGKTDLETLSTPNNGTSSFTQTFKVTSSDLASIKAYDATSSKEVHVFAVCNVPAPLTFTLKQDVQNVLSLTDADNSYTSSYWGGSTGFLMSNAQEAVVSSFDFDGIKAGSYNSEEKAYKPLSGSIKVERAMARFDINKDQPTVNSFDNVKIVFDGVAMVNVSKKFNLFKQVGTPSEWKYFAAETSDNYVIDPVQEKSTLTNLSQHFYYTIGTINPSELTYKSYTELTTSDNDVTGNGVVGEMSDRDYYIWDYCTPNSVYDYKAQKNGNSTGVVFRAEIQQADSKTIPGFAEGEVLYSFGGILYGNESALKALSETPGSDLNDQLAGAAYKAAEGEAGSKGATNLKAAGFNVYKKDQTDNKYYCYYFYWNRHNSGVQKDEMTPMEFAVVRNNVYKLAVTKVTGLGHPGNRNDDNNPVNPSDDNIKPDEEFYFQVSVEVEPWSVRVNDIEF